MKEVIVIHRDYFPGREGNYQVTERHQVEDEDEVQSHAHGYFFINDSEGRCFIYPIANVIKIGIGAA